MRIKCYWAQTRDRHAYEYNFIFKWNESVNAVKYISHSENLWNASQWSCGLDMNIAARKIINLFIPSDERNCTAVP